MNERIRELEKLATPRCYDETGCYIGNKFDVAKFAELIVQECIDIIAPYSVRMIKPGEEYLHPIQEIKEHFGVAELKK
jgi:hypothetical protein